MGWTLPVDVRKPAPVSQDFEVRIVDENTRRSSLSVLDPSIVAAAERRRRDRKRPGQAVAAKTPVAAASRIGPEIKKLLRHCQGPRLIKVHGGSGRTVERVSSYWRRTVGAADSKPDLRGKGQIPDSPGNRQAGEQFLHHLRGRRLSERFGKDLA